VRAERIYHSHPDGGEGLLAVVLRGGEDSPPGVHFLTDSQEPLQLATIRHQAPTVVGAHLHPERSREVRRTQEFLWVVRGSVRLDLYASDGSPATAGVVLLAGEAVLLLRGGHRVETLVDETELVECKGGPYPGAELDKVRL
jgi:hypothetical protein